MLITSMDNDKVKYYTKLQDKKHRDITNEFIVEGMHLVLEALRAGVIKEIIMEEDEVVPFNVPIVSVTSEIMRKISNLDSPSEIMALCRKKEECPELGKRILVLDSLQDPGNLGTIIRSAKAFHIDTIVLGENTVDLYNPKVIRSTQGMMFHINIIKRNLVPFLREIKSRDIPIYGTKVEHGIDVATLKKDEKNSFVLVMGNEGNGVREEILELCNAFIYIETDAVVESLNVSIATSIILYELDR